MMNKNHSRQKKGYKFALGQVSGVTKLKQGKTITRDVPVNMEITADTIMVSFNHPKLANVLMPGWSPGGWDWVGSFVSTRTQDTQNPSGVEQRGFMIK